MKEHLQFFQILTADKSWDVIKDSMIIIQKKNSNDSYLGLSFPTFMSFKDFFNQEPAKDQRDLKLELQTHLHIFWIYFCEIWRKTLEAGVKISHY